MGVHRLERFDIRERARPVEAFLFNREIAPDPLQVVDNVVGSKLPAVYGSEVLPLDPSPHVQREDGAVRGPAFQQAGQQLEVLVVHLNQKVTGLKPDFFS